MSSMQPGGWPSRALDGAWAADTDLARRAPLTITLPAGTLLHRFHTAAFDPVFFDRSRFGRFNAPDGSYGVLYVAATAEGAFAETFLREPGRTLLPTDLLASRAYVVLRTTRPLVLVRLGGAGLARLGSTAEVVHGGPPMLCRRPGHRPCRCASRRGDRASLVASRFRIRPFPGMIEYGIFLLKEKRWFPP